MIKNDLKKEVRRIGSKLTQEQPLTSTELAFLAEQLSTATELDILRSLFFCCRMLNDPDFAPLLEPHLQSTNVDIASGALWVLCWLGEAERLKPYIMEAADIGFPWDSDRKVGGTALVAAGEHLKNHRDREFAQLLVRWTPPDDPDNLPIQPLPSGMCKHDFRMFLWNAGTGMGVAVGADPKALLDDKALYAACVKRFLAERQDG